MPYSIKKAEIQRIPAIDCDKLLLKRKGSGNKEFPDFNPQAETALFAEENGVFQGFSDIEKPME